jgi:hypothetical protein
LSIMGSLHGGIRSGASLLMSPTAGANPITSKVRIGLPVR